MDALDKTPSNISKHDRLPQPQNTNHISSAPFREKLLSNSSYLAAEIPLKLGHWVSHLWNQQEQQQSSSDSTLWLLGCEYAVNMSTLEKDMMRAQREPIFDTTTTTGEDNDDDDDETTAETGDNTATASASSAPSSYDMTMPPDFYHDLCSRLWMTYRHNFPPIRPSAYKTDIGWGCMLRSGQSLLANTLLIHCLGRDWRREDNAEQNKEYRKIIQWFLDELSPRAPFSIHRIALLGKQLGKSIGEWFGPNTISQVILALVSDFPAAHLSVYIASDVVYRDDVEDVISGKRPRGDYGWCQSQEARDIYRHYTPVVQEQAGGGSGAGEAVLILVAIRLGIDQLHPTYYPALKECMRLPWFVGIAGGRPNSSLYFVGLQGDDLFYLDPHFSRPALETLPMHEYTKQDLDTYHCPIPRKIHISQLDPSMMLGFYCRTRTELDAFCERITQMSKIYTPIFTIAKRAPEYDEDVRSENDFGIVSDEEEEEHDAVSETSL
ncbi:cysteine protease atg4a [Lichtheimia corymbifera JMRC:FSU:9682]|uniref:Cysteine protease n=1 Tax=Lichtheimia corymbifera JMRC:FSU:9682 TaxID=1263082 RepID=A0A068RY48_9FUNG|nr:cysteine protease atg4a [Lichtheimia corymbifera JMRC:FSU:9682]